MSIDTPKVSIVTTLGDRNDFISLLKYQDGEYRYILSPKTLKVGDTIISGENVEIKNGERVAQMVIAKHEQAEWSHVSELKETERGAGGFGSTGTH